MPNHGHNEAVVGCRGGNCAEAGLGDCAGAEWWVQPWAAVVAEAWVRGGKAVPGEARWQHGGGRGVAQG